MQVTGTTQQLARMYLMSLRVRPIETWESERKWNSFDVKPNPAFWLLCTSISIDLRAIIGRQPKISPNNLKALAVYLGQFSYQWEGVPVGCHWNLVTRYHSRQLICVAQVWPRWQSHYITCQIIDTKKHYYWCRPWPFFSLRYIYNLRSNATSDRVCSDSTSIYVSVELAVNLG